MTPHALFFDWDNTLSFGGTVPEENRRALAAAKKAGHYLFLNTGRSRGFIPPEAWAAADWDGIIAGCAYVELRGRVLVSAVVSRAALEAAWAFYRATGIVCMMEGVNDLYIFGKYKDCPDIAPDFDKFLDAHYDEMQITKFRFNADISGLPGASFPGCWVLCHPTYSEITPNGYGKDTGIRLVTEALGIPRENTVSFGDSANDRAMLAYTGTSVVMASAPAELDDVATLRTKSGENGVAEAIAALGLTEANA